MHAKAGDATAVGFLHGHEAIPSNYDIVLPSDQRQSGEPIQDYLGRVGIVVVHSKIIVIDPLGANPVVMTGSHNMGVKAATKNDDNLVIIEGDRDLAIAYALNIISVFNHFWWRHNAAPISKRKKAQAAGADPAGPQAGGATIGWKGLQTSDTWQDKFFIDATASNEAKFWGALA
jgi:phosphatidylserine/phosphatidylglycerophosphate/cardiolipin synthase-like enzyme